MKKSFLLILLLTGTIAAQAGNIKLGLRVAPGLALNSVKWTGDGDDYEKAGAGFSMSVGPNIDFMFSERAGFMTGIWFTTKRAGYLQPAGGKDTKIVFNLQYIQIPFALKMYTDEVATDMKVYFTVGGTLDFRISEKLKVDDKSVNYETAENGDKKFTNIIDMGVLLGTGVEYQLGTNTFLFGGISYNRGLFNLVNITLDNGDGGKIKDDLKISTSQLSLEVGLKF